MKIYLTINESFKKYLKLEMTGHSFSRYLMPSPLYLKD